MHDTRVHLFLTFDFGFWIWALQHEGLVNEVESLNQQLTEHKQRTHALQRQKQVYLIRIYMHIYIYIYIYLTMRVYLGFMHTFMYACSQPQKSDIRSADIGIVKSDIHTTLHRQIKREIVMIFSCRREERRARHFSTIINTCLHTYSGKHASFHINQYIQINVQNIHTYKYYTYSGKHASFHTDQYIQINVQNIHKLIWGALILYASSCRTGGRGRGSEPDSEANKDLNKELANLRAELVAIEAENMSLRRQVIYIHTYTLPYAYVLK